MTRMPPNYIRAEGISSTFIMGVKYQIVCEAKVVLRIRKKLVGLSLHEQYGIRGTGKCKPAWFQWAHSQSDSLKM